MPAASPPLPELPTTAPPGLDWADEYADPAGDGCTRDRSAPALTTLREAEADGEVLPEELAPFIDLLRGPDDVAVAAARNGGAP